MAKRRMGDAQVRLTLGAFAVVTALPFIIGICQEWPRVDIADVLADLVVWCIVFGLAWLAARAH